MSNAIFKKIQRVTKNATRNATKCCNFNLILMFVRPDKICIYDALDNKKMQQQMTKSDAKNCCILCCILGVFYAPFTCKSNNGELRLYRDFLTAIATTVHIFPNLPKSTVKHIHDSPHLCCI